MFNVLWKEMYALMLPMPYLDCGGRSWFFISSTDTFQKTTFTRNLWKMQNISGERESLLELARRVISSFFCPTVFEHLAIPSSSGNLFSPLLSHCLILKSLAHMSSPGFTKSVLYRSCFISVLAFNVVLSSPYKG